MEQLKTEMIDYGDGIYAIDQQMVRAFLIVGKERALLLDTGAVRVDILKYIGQITELPVTVILTHGDGDHIGNLQDFETAYIHENDIQAVLSHEQCKDVKLIPLSHDDIIDIGTRKLKVLFTPGHTAGSICLLDEANKILFAGDTISYGPIFMFGARRNMGKFLESLQLLRQMKNDGVYDRVYCCHNVCPISPDTVEELISCTQGILDKTIAGIPAPMPIQTGDKPLLCKYGKCMILIEGEND